METYYPELIGGARSFTKMNTLPEFNASIHLGDIIYVKYEDAFYFGTAIGWYGLGPYGPTGGTGGSGGLGKIGVSGGTGGSGGSGYTGATGGADSACCFNFAVNNIPTLKTNEDFYQQIDTWNIKHNLNTNYYFINIFNSDGTEYQLKDIQLTDKTTIDFNLKDIEGFVSKGNVIVTKALCLKSPKPYHKEQHDYFHTWLVNVDPRLLDIDTTEIYFYSIFGELLEPISIVGINETQIQVKFKNNYRGYSFVWADDNPEVLRGGSIHINDTYDKDYIVNTPTHEWVFEHNFNVEEPDTELIIEVYDINGNLCPQFDFDFERYETVNDFYKAKGIVPDSSPESVILNTSSCPLLLREKTYNNPATSDFDNVRRSAVDAPFDNITATTKDLTLPALKAPFNNYKKSNISYFEDKLGYIIKSNTSTTLKINFFKFKNESLPIPTNYIGKINIKYYIDKIINTSFCHKKVNEHVHIQHLLSSVWYITHNLNTKNIRINLDILNNDSKYLVCYLTNNKIKIYFYKYDHEFLAYENIDDVVDRTLPSNITLVKRSGRAFIFRAVPLIGYNISDTPSVKYFPEDGRILVHTQYFPHLTDEEANTRMSLKHFPIQSLIVKERELNNDVHCMTIRHNAGTKENLEVEFFEILDIDKMVKVDPDYIVYESPDVLRLYFTVPAETTMSNMDIQVKTVIPKRGIVKVYHVPVNDEISPLKNDNYKTIIPETYYKHKYTFTHRQKKENIIWNIKHNLLETNKDLYKFFISSCSDCFSIVPYTINILNLSLVELPTIIKDIKLKLWLKDNKFDEYLIRSYPNITFSFIAVGNTSDGCFDGNMYSNSTLVSLIDPDKFIEMSHGDLLELNRPDTMVPFQLIYDIIRPDIKLIDIIYVDNDEVQLVFNESIIGEVTFSIDLPLESMLPTNLCDKINATCYRHVQQLKSHIWYVNHDLDTLNPIAYAICDSNLFPSQQCCHPVPVRIYPKIEIVSNNKIKLIFQQVLCYQGAAIITVKDEALYEQLQKLPWLIFGEGDTGGNSIDFQHFTKQDIIDFRTSFVPTSKPANLMFQALDNYGETLAPDQNAVYLDDSSIEMDFTNLLNLYRRLNNGYCIIKSVDVKYDPTRIDSQTVQIYDQSRDPEYLTISTPTTGKAYITDGNNKVLRAPLHIIDLSAIFVPPSKKWVIKHDYNTTSLSIRCYDPLGEPMYPDAIDYVSDNEVHIYHSHVMVLGDQGNRVDDLDYIPNQWQAKYYDICSRLLIRKISNEHPQRNESFHVHVENVETWSEFVKRTENRTEYFRSTTSEWPDTYWRVRHNLNTRYPKLTFFNLDGSVMDFSGEQDPPYRIYYINDQYLEVCWLPSDPRVHESMRTPGKVLVQRVSRAFDKLLSNCNHITSGTGGIGQTGTHSPVYITPPVDYCTDVIDYTIDSECIVSSDRSEILDLKTSLLKTYEVPADLTEYYEALTIYSNQIKANVIRRDYLDKKYKLDVIALEEKHTSDCAAVDLYNANLVRNYYLTLQYNADRKIYLDNKYISDLAALEAKYLADCAKVDEDNATALDTYNARVIYVNNYNANIETNYQAALVEYKAATTGCNQTFHPDIANFTSVFTPANPALNPWIINNDTEFSDYSLSEIATPSFRLSEPDDLYDNFIFPVKMYFNVMLDTVMCAVIAHTEVDGVPYNLCVCRAAHGALYKNVPIPNYFIAYNFGLPGFRIIQSRPFDEHPSSYGSYTLSPNLIPYTSYTQLLYRLVVQICKSGSTVTVATDTEFSEYKMPDGSTRFSAAHGWIRPENILSLDLNSDPDLVKFIGPQRVGYGGMGTLATVTGRPAVRAFWYFMPYFCGLTVDPYSINLDYNADGLRMFELAYLQPYTTYYSPVAPIKGTLLFLPTYPVHIEYPVHPPPLPQPVYPEDPDYPTLKNYPLYPNPVSFPVYPIDPDPPISPPPDVFNYSNTNIFDCSESTVWVYDRDNQNWEVYLLDDWIGSIVEDQILKPCQSLKFNDPIPINLGVFGQGGTGHSPTGGTGDTGATYTGSCSPSVGGTGGSGGTGGTGRRNTLSLESGCCPFDFDGIDSMNTNFGVSVLRFQPDYPNNHNRNIIFDKYFNSIPMLTETFIEDMGPDGITPNDQSLYPVINPAIDDQWQHARYIYTIDKGGSRIGVKIQPGKFTGDCNPVNQINAMDIDDAAYIRRREESLDYESRPLLSLKRTSVNLFNRLLLYSVYRREYRYHMFGVDITSTLPIPTRTYDEGSDDEVWVYKKSTGVDRITVDLIHHLFYYRLFSTPLKNKEFIVTLSSSPSIVVGSVNVVQSNPDGSPEYPIQQSLFVIIAYKIVLGNIHTLSIIRRKTLSNTGQIRPNDSTFHLVYNYELPDQQFLYSNFVGGTNLGVDNGAVGGWYGTAEYPASRTVTFGIARIGDKIRINSSLFNKTGFPDPDVVIDLATSTFLNIFLDETNQSFGFGCSSLDQLSVSAGLYDVDVSNHNIPNVCDQRSGGLWKWDDYLWKWNYTPEACCRKSDYRFVAAQSSVRYYDISWYKQWYYDNPNDIYDTSSLVGFTGHSGEFNVSGEQWPEEVLQVLDDQFFFKMEDVFQTDGIWVWCNRFLNPGQTYNTALDIQKYQSGWVYGSFTNYPVKNVYDSRPPLYGTQPYVYTINKVKHFGHMFGDRYFGAYGCRKPPELGKPNSNPSYCAAATIRSAKEGVVATIGTVFAVYVLEPGEQSLFVLSPVNDKWVPCHAAYIENTYNEDFRTFMTEIGESESNFTYWYLKGGSMVFWTYEPIWVQMLDDDGNHDYWELRGGATHWVDFRKYMKPDSLLTEVSYTEAPGCKTEGYDHEVWWVWTGNLGRTPSHHEGSRLIAIDPNKSISVVVDTPFERGPGDGPGGNPHWAKDTLNRFVWVNRFNTVTTEKITYPFDTEDTHVLTDWEYEYSYGTSQVPDQIYDELETYQYLYWPLITPPPGLIIGGSDTIDPNMLTTGPRPPGTKQLDIIDSNSTVTVKNDLGQTIHTWPLKLLWIKNEVGDEEDHRVIVFSDQRQNKLFPPYMQHDLSGHGLVYKYVNGMKTWVDYGPVMTNKAGFVWNQWDKKDHRNINVCQKLAVNTYVDDDGYSLYFEFTNALTGDPVNIYWQCINTPEKLEIVVSYIYLYEERWLNVLRDPMHRIIPGAKSVAESWDDIPSGY